MKSVKILLKVILLFIAGCILGKILLVNPHLFLSIALTILGCGVLTFIFIILRLLYVFNDYMKTIDEEFELLTKLHKEKYLSYFSKDPNKIKDYTETFDKHINFFIEELEDAKNDKDLTRNLPPHYLEKLQKTLDKAKEMKEKDYIEDYSI